MTVTFPDKACAVGCSPHEKHICCWSDNSNTKHWWKKALVLLWHYSNLQGSIVLLWSSLVYFECIHKRSRYLMNTPCACFLAV